MSSIGETCAMSGFRKSGAHQHLAVRPLEAQPKDVGPRRNPDGRCEDMHKTRVGESRYGSHALQRQASVTIELLLNDLQDLANARMQAWRLPARRQFSEPGFDSRRIQRDGIAQLPAPQGITDAFQVTSLSVVEATSFFKPLIRSKYLSPLI